MLNKVIMAQKFDFQNLGKRMPYTMPDDTVETLQANVFTALRKERQSKRRHSIARWSYLAGIMAAACVALLLMMKWPAGAPDDPLTQIDLAYSNLSDADQDYMIEIYQEDFFINQVQE